MSKLSIQDLVHDFHAVYGCAINQSIRNKELSNLRLRLMYEELREVVQGIELNDIIKVADGLGDLLYVVYGSAISWGIDLDSVVLEIHKSNMSKLGEDGKPIYRDDGKVLKGPNYKPPNLESIVNIT